MNKRKQILNLTAYEGRWVALSKNRVVAVGTSLPDVMRKVPPTKRRLQPSIFLVPRRDEGPYVLVIAHQ